MCVCVCACACVRARVRACVSIHISIIFTLFFCNNKILNTANLVNVKINANQMICSIFHV
jgi:hypothetical protein